MFAGIPVKYFLNALWYRRIVLAGPPRTVASVVTVVVPLWELLEWGWHKSLNFAYIPLSPRPCFQQYKYQLVCKELPFLPKLKFPGNSVNAKFF